MSQENPFGENKIWSLCKRICLKLDLVWEINFNVIKANKFSEKHNMTDFYLLKRSAKHSRECFWAKILRVEASIMFWTENSGQLFKGLLIN